MRKAMTALVAGIVLGLVFGGMALPASSQGPGGRTTITVFDPHRTDYSKDVNVGRKGFSPGDWNLSIEKLLDPETCEPAGRAIVRFTIVKLVGDNNADFILEFTYIRSDGKITAYSGGRFSDFENGFAFPVTGGSDAYKDATGEVAVEENVRLCDKRGATLTFDLAL